MTTGSAYSRTRCRPLDPHVTRAMAAVLAGRTDEHLNAQFGISYNTWRKIESGRAIRVSVAERLEQRVRRAMEAQRGSSAPNCSIL